MARKPTPHQPEQADLSPDEVEKGIRRLERQLEKVRAFDPTNLDPQDPYSTVRPYEESVKTALAETFGVGTVEYIRFQGAARFDWPIFIGGSIPHHEKIEHVAKDRNRSIQLLVSAVELLRDRLDDQGASIASKGGAHPPVAASDRIFIVHGHDDGPKEAVARFIERLGYRPVVLHEQPNRGRTIIQKFQEEAADVGFAIVLMTPDDQMPSKAFRARQNVVLELGFFLGRLGPGRVAAIVKDAVETPSDFDGVIYIPYDSGWKQAVAKELAAANYKIDWNVVMA
jgi:predicted nucleotide-binding protein